MPTVSPIPIDVQWINVLNNNGSLYVGAFAALAAAVALSAANGNAPVYVAQALQQATELTVGSAKVDVNALTGQATPTYYVVLVSAATLVYPLAQALIAAYALSNTNQLPVYICRVLASITAP